MIKLELGGEACTLLADGALLLDATATVLVADVHIGKAEVFGALGVPVPRMASARSLQRLDSLLTRTRARHLVVLGDWLHGKASHQPQVIELLSQWRSRHADLRMSLIRGNHDRRAGDFSASAGFEQVDDLVVNDRLLLCHEPVRRSELHVIAGHLHPVVRIQGRADDSLRLRCFWLREGLTVLPAFGEFTGGFAITRDPHDRVFAIAEDQVIEVPQRTRCSGRPVRRGR